MSDSPEELKREADGVERFAPNLRIVLVEPLYQGNVGSVCRIMKNFGFTELCLVNPCPLEGEARAMSSHAVDVLRNAKICSTIEEAVAGCDVVIGTTGMRAQKGCDHIRTPALTPAVLRVKMEEFHPETKFAVLFGREDIGFTNDELSFCSMIATVPSSHIYPVMNLSHAVGIMVYELSGANLTGKYKTVDFKEFEAMCAHFGDVLNDMEFDPLKKEKMALMMKRIFARAELTPCEAKTLRGIFRNIQYHARKSKGEDVGKYRRDIENLFEEGDFENSFNLDFETDLTGKPDPSPANMDSELSVTLRKWEKTDVESVAKFANNQKIADNLRNAFPFPYTTENAEKFIDNILHTDEASQCFRAVDLNGKAVGSISITIKEDIALKSAEIGYWLAEPFWGRGIMTEAVRRMVTYTFENYDVSRIFAEPKAENFASRKVLENAGFVLEGIMRKSVFKNGKYSDSCMYALIK